LGTPIRRIVPHFGSDAYELQITHDTCKRNPPATRGLPNQSRAPTRRNFSFLVRAASGNRAALASDAGPPLEPQPANKLPVAVRARKKSAEETPVTPNQVTVARILVAFAAVALFSFRSHLLALNLTAVLLTSLAMALDGVDGYLARTRGLSTPFGAKFDILGDRVVENLFFTCFAASGLISLWVPVVFFARGALTDFLRQHSFRPGARRSDENWMLKTRWGRTLVASRASRACYAAVKCVCFCYLGLLLSIGRGPQFARWDETGARGPLVIAQAITLLAVLFCLLRAIPVLWEWRGYFRARASAPKPAMVGVTR
jgi:CDP-diacylglycerol---glycerol-3-phosphate 3-phosphatidyltransferase